MCIFCYIFPNYSLRSKIYYILSEHIQFCIYSCKVYMAIHIFCYKEHHNTSIGNSSYKIHMAIRISFCIHVHKQEFFCNLFHMERVKFLISKIHKFLSINVRILVMNYMGNYTQLFLHLSNKEFLINDHISSILTF